MFFHMPGINDPTKFVHLNESADENPYRLKGSSEGARIFEGMTVSGSLTAIGRREGSQSISRGLLLAHHYSTQLLFEEAP